MFSANDCMRSNPNIKLLVAKRLNCMAEISFWRFLDFLSIFDLCNIVSIEATCVRVVPFWSLKCVNFGDVVEISVQKG